MQEGVGLWIEDLLKNTPGLEEYIDTAELLRFLQSEEIDTPKFMGTEKTLAFAYWLRSYRGVSPSRAKMEALSH